MIGIDALVQQRLMMDFEKRADQGRGRARAGAISRRRDRDHREAPARPADPDRRSAPPACRSTRSSTPGRKSRSAISRCATSCSASNRDKFWTSPRPASPARPSICSWRVIAELQLGSVTLRNVPIAFADVPPFTVFGLSERACAAARHRHPGDRSAASRSTSGAQGPLPAQELRVDGGRDHYLADLGPQPPVVHRRPRLSAVRLRATPDRSFSGH